MISNFAIFLCTKISPGRASVMTDSGTRESEHPIHNVCILVFRERETVGFYPRTWGVCPLAESSKKWGWKRRTPSTHSELETKRLWRTPSESSASTWLCSCVNCMWGAMAGMLEGSHNERAYYIPATPAFRFNSVWRSSYIKSRETISFPNINKCWLTYHSATNLSNFQQTSTGTALAVDRSRI